MVKRGKLLKNKLAIADSVPSFSPLKQTKEQMEQERRWRAEDDLRSINRAEKIRSDSKRMADVKSLAQEQITNLKKIAK